MMLKGQSSTKEGRTHARTLVREGHIKGQYPRIIYFVSMA